MKRNKGMKAPPLPFVGALLVKKGGAAISFSTLSAPWPMQLPFHPRKDPRNNLSRGLNGFRNGGKLHAHQELYLSISVCIYTVRSIVSLDSFPACFLI